MSKMKFKPYIKYKDSGVDWIGKIPEHWNIKKLKYVVKLINEKIDTTQSDLQYTGLENIESHTGRLIESNEKFEPEGSANVFYEGDILFNKLRPYLAKAFRATFKGCCTTELLVLRLIQQDNPYYLLYLLLSEKIIKIVDSSTYGTKMPRASWNFIGNLSIILPNYQEQEQISIFLDQETSQINATIKKYEKLIELLKEKRIALISHAVTKGLNPDVKMKDSGVEWIGEVPEHWEIKRLKFLGKVFGGYAFKSEDFSITGVKVIKIANIQSFNLDWSEQSYLPDEYAKEYAEFIVKKGDIIFALTRPIISTGIKVVFFEEEEPCLLNQRTGVFKFSSKIHEKYLYYSVYSRQFAFNFSSKITETNQPNISPYDVGNVFLCLPHVKEQMEIANYLDQETSKIDQLIEKINKQIEQLNEYKTSLISHAVTGKIDVRQLA